MAYYKTRNTGTWNYNRTSNTGRTPEHWWNNGTLVEQSEYHRIVEHEKNSRITEQQDNTKKYYQYRTTTYWADNITKFKTTVCNFQYMKGLVELTNLLSNFFCCITRFVNHLIRCNTGQLTNEAFMSNPIVSSKQ